MNRERAKELLPIIQAFADGEVIQFRGPSGRWNETTSGTHLYFGENAMEYRIKPKNKTVKLNDTYTAEIFEDTKTVAVGCQSFSFDAVKELYEALPKEDDWIKWDHSVNNKCPVQGDLNVEVRLAGGCSTTGVADGWDWGDCYASTIVAYRVVK